MTNRGLLQGVLQAWAAYFFAQGLVGVGAALQFRFGDMDLGWAGSGFEEQLFKQQLVEATTHLVLSLLVFRLAHRVATLVFPETSNLRDRAGVLHVALAAVGVCFALTGLQASAALLLVDQSATNRLFESASASIAARLVVPGINVGVGLALATAAVVFGRRGGAGVSASERPQVSAPTTTALKLTGAFFLVMALLYLILLFAMWLAEVRGPISYVLLPALLFATIGALYVRQADWLGMLAPHGRAGAGNEPPLSHGVVRQLAFGLAGWYAVALATVSFAGMIFLETPAESVRLFAFAPESMWVFTASVVLALGLVLLLEPRGLARLVRGLSGQARPMDTSLLPPADLVRMGAAAGGATLLLTDGIPFLLGHVFSSELMVAPAGGAFEMVLGQAVLGAILLLGAVLSRFREVRSLVLAAEVGALAAVLSLITAHIGTLAGFARGGDGWGLQ